MKLIAMLLLLIAVAACSSPKYEDITNVEGEGDSAITVNVVDPDSMTVYRNVDGFPNVGVMCINGDAIVMRGANWSDWRVTHLLAGEHNLCG